MATKKKKKKKNETLSIEFNGEIYFVEEHDGVEVSRTQVPSELVAALLVKAFERLLNDHISDQSRNR